MYQRGGSFFLKSIKKTTRIISFLIFKSFYFASFIFVGIKIVVYIRDDYKNIIEGLKTHTNTRISLKRMSIKELHLTVISLTY